ncbi:MAG: DUF695 domain-containing protein [Puia sp.]|nr:DUF695 domain-containing protein [Puia sp.]
MGFLQKLFAKKEETTKSYGEFWDWFQKHEKAFHKVIKQRDHPAKNFFEKLSPRLNDLKDGFFYLTGMLNEKTAELVFTPDGIVRNIVFVEELVSAAPEMEGWKFTALKPAVDIRNLGVKMEGLTFNNENMSFYSTGQVDFPDEIDITIVHSDLTEENRSNITRGVCIFLDNFLGELNFVTTIDNISVLGTGEAAKELIPIEKLKDFLIWRQKEFVGKYEGVRRNTEKDNHSILEAQLKNGNALIAVINTDLLEWDHKSSHPWILDVGIQYDGKGNNGMPDKNTHQILDEIEKDILRELKDFDGYLNIGRQTADSNREIYFACRDFRKPSKVLHAIQQKYAGRQAITFDIYKDKYWQSFARFMNDGNREIENESF